MKIISQGQWDDSEVKALVAKPVNLSSVIRQDQHSGRRELIPTSYPLTSTYIYHGKCVHVHTHTIKKKTNKQKLKIQLLGGTHLQS